MSSKFFTAKNQLRPAFKKFEAGGIMKVFGLGSTREIAEGVALEAGIKLSVHTEEKFPDSELKIITKESVKNSPVIVFQSISGDEEKTLNDRLCELYFFLCLLKDRGAAHITAVIPYFAYARSDQRKNPEDPLTLRYVAQLLELGGANRVLALDIHNIAAFENAFRIPCVNVEAAQLFCRYLLQSASRDQAWVILSPDIGGIKRAEKFRRSFSEQCGFNIESAFLEKFRTADGLEGDKLVGDVRGKNVVIVDDMISTGATILRAVEACKKNQCKNIQVFATHGLFVKNEQQLLNSEFIDEIIITDSYPLRASLNSYKKLKILPCSELFSQRLFLQQ